MVSDWENVDITLLKKGDFLMYILVFILCILLFIVGGIVLSLQKKQGVKIAGKILIAAGSLLFLLPIWFYFLIILQFSGEVLYSALWTPCLIAAWLYLVLMLFGVLRNKTAKILPLACIILIPAIIVGSNEAYRAYLNGIPEVSAEVNLYEYQPFVNGTKAVKLDRPSALQLSEPLPRINGATALYPIYSAFAMAAYPEGDYPYYGSAVACDTTPEAYRKLVDGEADIIFAAGPSEAQLAYAEEKGVELSLTPIGREAFVFFVNSQNPVDNLTVEQIQQIYSGDLTDWSQVGGNRENIRAFQRDEGSGSQTALQKLMKGKNLMNPPSQDVATGMGGIIQRTADYKNFKNAIGFSFRFYATEMAANEQIKLLKLNGVPPTEETIRNGSYPIASEFYAVTAGTENPNVPKLIEWVLSEQGQEIIENTGYVPIRTQE